FPVGADAPDPIVEDKAGNIAAKGPAVFAGGPEMKAGEDAGIGELVHRRREARIEPNPSRHRWRFEDEWGVVAEVIGQHGGSRARGARMARWILRMRRGRAERRPS